MSVFCRVWVAILLVLWMSTPGLAASDENREGGIIGTGIVGTITRLGSIHVNGQLILIDAEAPVRGSVPPLTASGLRPGHTVAVTATRTADGWRAHSIRQVFPLVGPVSAMDGRVATILGTRVDLGDQAARVSAGDWLAISGLWKEQQVVATRVDHLTGKDHEARLSGTYLGPDQSGSIVVGGSQISGIVPQHLEPGDLVRVIGEPGPSGIVATTLETDLFDDAVGLIQVQGYYSVPRSNGLYTVLGSGLVAYTEQPEMIDQNSRVIRCGQHGQLTGNAVTNTPGGQEAWAELGCN